MQRSSVSAVFLVVLLLGLAGSTSAADDAAKPPPQPRVSSTGGLTTAVFSAPAGKVTVYLPDDMAAGDTITGTVVAEPAGANDAERQQNRDELQGVVVEVEGQKASASGRIFRWVVPPALSGAALVIRDARGSAVGQVTVPVSPLPNTPFTGAPRPNDYQMPKVIQAGRPLQISGPFDGDAANTSADLAGHAVQPLAESPRQFIGAAPSDVSGPTQITLKERGLTVTAPARCVTVQLTMSRSTLRRDENATLTMVVGGLDKLSAPTNLILTNRTPDIVTLDGGTPQTVTIAPSDVAPDGTARVQRGLHGLGPGPFTIVAQAEQAKPPARAGRFSDPRRTVDVLSPENGGLAHGVVRIKANPADPSIVVNSAAFFYRALKGGKIEPIGTQTDGADQRITCGQPTAASPGASGWAIDWNTAVLADGPYELTTQLETSIGNLSAATRAFVERAPPIPEITSPVFGENVSGPVRIFANGGPGVKGGVAVKPAPQVITLPTHPVNQHDHKYDGDDGKATCDPSAQASILWMYATVRDKMRDAAKADKQCKGKTGQALDDCALDLLVKWLAWYKKTGKDGTDYGNELSGSNAFLDWLGLKKWRIVQVGSNTSPLSFRTLKNKLAGLGDRLKGAVIHAAEVGKKGSGHAMALKSIDDAKDKDGKHKVCMMDPDTGKEICVKMSDDGEFKYPDENGKTWQMQGAGVFEGDPKDKTASLVATDNVEGWVTVAKLGPSTGGWRAIWNTKEFTPGFYLIRLTVTDKYGHTGSDMVEVRLER